MILVHNHPSGDLSPSREDCILTDTMIRLCHMMGIPLLDHVIVGGDNSSYFSFRDKGIFENPHFEACTDYMDLSFDRCVAEESGGAGNTGGKSMNGPKRGATEERIR